MRRLGLIAGFGLGAVVLVGALLWILRLTLDLEAAEVEARLHAAREERVRLALWRMDSALSAFLAYENAQPVDPPAGARRSDPPWIERRFEVAGDEPAPLAPAEDGEATRVSPIAAERLLALLGQPPLAAPPAPEPAPARRRTVVPPPPGPARSGEALADAAPPAKPPEPVRTAASDPPPDATRVAASDRPPSAARVPPSDRPSGAAAGESPIVHQEAQVQALRNVAEFTQRQKFASQQSAFVAEPRELPAEPVAEPPAAPATAPPATTAQVGGGDGDARGETGDGGGEGERSDAAATVRPGDPAPAATLTPPARQPSTPDRQAATATPARQPATPDRQPAAVATLPPPRPRGPTGVVQALDPVWADDRLLLVRRVVRDGAESLQGIEIDADRLEGWLLGEVGDLLPAGALEPAPAVEVSDPGRRLALLPLRLEPGPVAAIEATTTTAASPVRLGLGLAVAAILLVALCSALVLLAGLRMARQRTEFASAVIHELRTPLTTFRVYTDLLADEMVPAAERPGYLATLRREAGRLGHLVDNVLAFARLERAGAPEARRIVLAPWLRETGEGLARRAAEAGLELRLELAPELGGVAVEADPIALERILHNLCQNSCRYGRGDGPARLDLGAELRGRRVAVRWRDYGPGVPRRARRKLFRAFQRPAGDRDPSPGVGLGLALSRRLARRFGGELRLADASGPGAAFELLLPRA